VITMRCWYLSNRVRIRDACSLRADPDVMLLSLAAQQCSTGVVYSQTWSTSDISPGSRDGGRGEVGGELVADATGSPPPMLFIL